MLRPKFPLSISHISLEALHRDAQRTPFPSPDAQQNPISDKSVSRSPADVQYLHNLVDSI